MLPRSGSPKDSVSAGEEAITVLIIAAVAEELSET